LEKTLPVTRLFVIENLNVMKLKVSFTAVLFMSYCLFLTVGCQQKKQGSDDKSVPQAIQKVIQI